MSEKILIKVFEVIGSGLGVSSDDGQVVHDQIALALKQGKRVELSFMNVESITSAFLNAAVGQLYGEFQEDEIRSGLAVVEMEADDAALLKRVVETAKQYFKDPKRFKQAAKGVLGDDDDK